MKYRRLIPLSFLIALVAVLLLVFRVGFPRHRAVSVAVYLLSWAPLVLSYRINRRFLHEQGQRVQRKARPWIPHVVAGVILLLMAYVAWVLVPVIDTPLVKMSDHELRGMLATDIESCFALNASVDALLDDASTRGLLTLRVDRLSPEERRGIKLRWRDGVMAFYEYELIKETYRGFHLINYAAKPSLHADAFFAEYAAFTGQYAACLRFVEMVGDNVFMETLLNETSEGIPANTYALMKQRLTHAEVLLRLNAGTAYYERVKKDCTAAPAQVTEVKAQRNEIYRRLGRHPGLFFDNPLAVLESASFKAWFPLQKTVALQMSRLRTTSRDYFITPRILAGHRDRLRPGDILLQRRNWHMTNIGIPGFWPHAAIYVGTPAELDEHFGDLPLPEGATPSALIRARYPAAYEALAAKDTEGYEYRVIEAIRPGVVFQSLERSAYCDYIGAMRPVLNPDQVWDALMEAFSHFGKPYDFNFDFSTDNELVCSELVYKAFQPYAGLGLQPEIVSGRLLLPPNGLAKVFDTGAEKVPPPFEFVFFLDANEASQSVTASGIDAFRSSWSRPKWDILQE